MKRIVLAVLVLIFALYGSAQTAAEKLTAANEAMKAQDFAKAYSLYDEAMSNLGDVQIDKAVNFNIGYAAYKIGNMEGAEKYFAKAIEGGTNVPKCYEYLALGYSDKKEFAKSVGNFEKAISTSTEDTKSLVFNAGVTAYRGELMDKAIEFFSKSIDNGYKGETALFYKAAILNKQGKADEYKATLELGVQKFQGDAKIGPALAKIYVNEGNEIYKKGAAYITTANQQVTAGKLKTSDEGYTKEVDKAKAEFKNALVILEKAKTLDATNPNVQKLIDACSQLLK